MLIVHSAEELLGFTSKRPLCRLGDEILDARIGPGINGMGIIELFGASACGKSTFAMQLVLQFLHDHIDLQTLFICTDGPFSSQRLYQLFQARYPDNCDFDQIASRIIVQHLGDLEAQEHFVCYFLRPLIEQENIRFVIFDSISANFRVSPRSPSVTNSLYRIAYILNSISFEFLVNVLCLNQVTDVITGSFSSPQDLRYKPALGLAWSNSISTRISISRPPETSSMPSLRRIFVVRSPNMGQVVLDCTLDNTGFRAN